MFILYLSSLLGVCELDDGLPGVAGLHLAQHHQLLLICLAEVGRDVQGEGHPRVPLCVLGHERDVAGRVGGEYHSAGRGW